MQVAESKAVGVYTIYSVAEYVHKKCNVDLYARWKQVNTYTKGISLYGLLLMCAFSAQSEKKEGELVDDLLVLAATMLRRSGSYLCPAEEAPENHDPLRYV